MTNVPVPFLWGPLLEVLWSVPVGLVLGKLRPGPKRSRCILTLPVLSRWEGSPSSTCCCCFSWCHPGCHLLSLLCRWVAGELATSCSACGPQMLLCGAVFQPTGPSMCWCLFIHKGSTCLFWTYQGSCQPICPAFPGSSEWQLGLPAAPSSVVSSAKLLKMCPAPWSRWCQYWLPYWPLGDTAGDTSGLQMDFGAVITAAGCIAAFQIHLTVLLPKLCFISPKKELQMFLEMVSKALLKVRKTTFTALPSSTKPVISSQKVIKLVKHCLPFINPSWS